MWQKIKRGAQRFGEWFDTERRQKFAAAVAAVAPLLIMFGVLTEGAAEQWSIIVGAVLATLGPVVSLVNLSRTALAGWLITSARGVLYGAAAAIFPALAALGLLTTEQSTNALALLSTSLTVLASVVAIFTASRQQSIEVAQVVHDQTVIETLTAPMPQQISTLADAAERLGVDPVEVTREAYRGIARD